MGYFQTYAATEGLDRFPEEKQFFVWLAVHKKLKVGDPGYLAACRRFTAKIVVGGLAFTLLLFSVSFLLDEVKNVGVELLLVLLIWLLTGLYTVWVLVISFRQQRWMNARVAEVIRKKPRREQAGRADSR